MHCSIALMNDLTHVCLPTSLDVP